MRNPAKPYLIATINYNPSWPDMPWYIQRTGTVAEQGGLNFGTESVSFQTIEAASIYLKETIERDMQEYENRIKELNCS